MSSSIQLNCACDSVLMNYELLQTDTHAGDKVDGNFTGHQWSHLDVCIMVINSNINKQNTVQLGEFEWSNSQLSIKEKERYFSLTFF